MGNDVIANGREISCKAADGKAIAAFPDVCFTPPQPPATPPGVPIPYPNTAFARDTTKGSKVDISRVALKFREIWGYHDVDNDVIGSVTFRQSDQSL